MKLFVLIYALLLLVGGVMGYIKAESTPSLVMGITTALLFTAIAFQKRRRVIRGAAVMVGIMTCFFWYRYAVTTKFVPAGLMGIISGIFLIWLIMELIQEAKKEQNVLK